MAADCALFPGEQVGQEESSACLVFDWGDLLCGVAQTWVQKVVEKLEIASTKFKAELQAFA